ncbi:MAG: hypothetical protein JWO31_703 [Phycisphaerales bacterium]|nr:hypothetical protein [Phycisphaerales bacterium]
MRKSPRLVLLASIVLTAGAFAAPASACPSCKDSIAMGSSEDTGTGGPSAGLPGGFNTSVYVMLTGLIGTLGFVGLNLYRAGRGVTEAHATVRPEPAAGR